MVIGKPSAMSKDLSVDIRRLNSYQTIKYQIILTTENKRQNFYFIVQFMKLHYISTAIFLYLCYCNLFIIICWHNGSEPYKICWFILQGKEKFTNFTVEEKLRKVFIDKNLNHRQLSNFNNLTLCLPRSQFIALSSLMSNCYKYLRSSKL